MIRRSLRRPMIVAWLLVAGPCVSARAVDDPQWKLPPGFTIELVAGPELVQHPTMGGFDDRGRLYICDSVGDNMPAKELLQRLPHNIKRLEDTDGDGRFDKSIVFADKLVFPMGALWHDGSIYTASPPNIWKLTDRDGDGVCDERKVLVSEFGFTGNAADVHGCFLGPEGRIWWCDGRHGHTFTDEQGNTLSKGLAARLFSCKPDGSDVRSFAGGGMDNPVEVAFTEEGEPIGTVAIYDHRPDRVDALIHWVYGGAYPYYEKVLPEFKKTGDLLPAVMRYGRVAPSGITRMRSTAWGADYADNLFHVQFNTHRLIRTKLTREGASFRGADEEFLISDNSDVHLTDVIEDADGSLLVVDTGGWFRQGCPNSQIAKPEILGGIYRIRKTDAAKIDDPRGLQIHWDVAGVGELRQHLIDPRPTVRSRAADTLVQRARSNAADVLAVLDRALDDDDDNQRLPVVWTLARIATSEARSLLQRAARDDNPRVCQSAVRALGILHDESSATRFIELLAAPEPAVQREAATALGRLKYATAVPSLLAVLSGARNDRFLEHAIVYALIEINDGSATLAGLHDADAAARRGALIALDQNDDPRLTRDVVAKLLDVGDARLQRAALGVMQRHPDWGDGILDYLKRRLAAASVPDDEAELLRDTILAYRADARVQQIVADALASAGLAPSQRKLLLEVLERSEFGPTTLPPAWAEQIAAHLQSADDAIVRQAVTVAVRIGGDRFDGALLAIGNDGAKNESLRIAALDAVGPRLPRLEPATFTMLTTRLTTAADSLDRLAAADVLGQAPLDAAERAVVVTAVAKAGPLELPPLLTLFTQDTPPEECRDLLQALATSPGLDNVPSSLLEKIVGPQPEDVRELAEPLFKRINADIETQRARLAELLPTLDGGDKARGAIVFQMHKTACNSCHRVGPKGAAIGPDLTKVGQVRSKSDILESVLFPSASFVRNFESVAVETSDGRVVVGLLARETPEAVYIRTAQKEEVRVPRSDVETIAPSKLSIMPQGLDKVMTADELRDLVAYLQSLK